MKCPNCDKDLPSKLLAKHFASHGGKAGKRKLSTDDLAKMRAGKDAKKNQKEDA